VTLAARRKTITKATRKTTPSERFNHTLRQRVSRLVRDTLAFPTKLANHIEAIKDFLSHSTLTKAAV
jgi:insertion element IS1 protein InsB